MPLAGRCASGRWREWHHVQLTGRFCDDKGKLRVCHKVRWARSAFTSSRLCLSKGDTVLVDRGFVPEALRDSKARAAGQVEGSVTLTGVLRFSQQPGLFTPAPDLKTRLWFIKDLPAIARAVGVAAAPVLVEADAEPNPGGWPLGGQTRVDIPNDHLQYAITWFGLALALTGVYLSSRARQEG